LCRVNQLQCGKIWTKNGIEIIANHRIGEGNSTEFECQHSHLWKIILSTSPQYKKQIHSILVKNQSFWEGGSRIRESSIIVWSSIENDFL